MKKNEEATDVLVILNVFPLPLHTVLSLDQARLQTGTLEPQFFLCVFKNCERKEIKTKWIRPLWTAMISLMMYSSYFAIVYSVSNRLSLSSYGHPETSQGRKGLEKGKADQKVLIKLLHQLSLFHFQFLQLRFQRLAILILLLSQRLW